MYNSFVRRNLIAKNATYISNSTDNMDKLADTANINAKLLFFAKPSNYEIMLKEIKKWYNEVFDYTEKWLKNNNFIKLKKGSFDGGFCVEENPNADVVKNWGAPLADDGNKVIQIKEKFGRVVVYFSRLTKQERVKINKFAKTVEKRFDCCTNFY